MSYKLSDKSISHLMQLLQLALLTGTDIMDHLRMFEMEADKNGVLDPTKDYEAVFDANIERLVEDADRLAKEMIAEQTGEAKGEC
jgi:hypothetical protein